MKSLNVVLRRNGFRIGYKIAEKLGHKIPEVAPSLFSMKVTDTSLCQLSGVSNFYTKVS